MADPKKRKEIKYNLITGILGKYPGRSLHRIGAAIAGIWITSTLLQVLWPTKIQLNTRNMKYYINATKSDESIKPLTILFINLEEMNAGDAINTKNYFDNSIVNSIILMKLERNKPINIIQIPIELATQIPGKKELIPLSETYRIGGPSLISESIRYSLGISKSIPTRFVIFKPKSIRTLINEIGGIEISVKKSIRVNSLKGANSFFLKSGEHQINGIKTEQIVLHKKNKYDDTNRRKRREEVIKGIVIKLQKPEAIYNKGYFIEDFLKLVETNLSESELLKLGSFSGISKQELIFKDIPLVSKMINSKIRKIKGPLKKPFWP